MAVGRRWPCGIFVQKKVQILGQAYWTFTGNGDIIKISMNLETFF